MEKVIINTEYITLGQFLKFVKIINNGGAEKNFIATNSIYVNNELENRRGRKLKDNDHLKIVDKEYVIECKLKG